MPLKYVTTWWRPTRTSRVPSVTWTPSSSPTASQMRWPRWWRPPTTSTWTCRVTTATSTPHSATQLHTRGPPHCCSGLIWWATWQAHMMMSSNGNIFRVTGPLCGEFTGPGEFPTQRPVTRSFDVFFDLRLNKQLSKQPWGWWFETPS